MSEINHNPCHWEKFFNDYFLVCDVVVNEGSNPVKQPESKSQGWAGGWLLCELACKNFKNADYNWFEDKCTCQGVFIPPMWR